MNRSELAELHYITPIANIPSILQHGVLCKNRAKAFDPVSIAMQEIQDARENKAVPGGLPLHDYANLYVCARNPMMYKRQAEHMGICVLRLDTSVLDLPNVVIADGNAASKYTAFWPSPTGLSKLDRERVFAEYWTDANQITQWQKASAKCAEALVPEKVSPSLIIGAYVSHETSKEKLREVGFEREIRVDRRLFFQG